MKSVLKKILKSIEPFLRKIYREITQPPPPNLEGDRGIEYAWIAAHLPEGPGTALDFGAGRGNMGLLAAMKGFDVTAIDLLPVDWLYQHDDLNFIQGDIFGLDFPDCYFDLVINCSAIEHVGLGERYQKSQSRPDGDLDAMAVLRRITKPGKRMIMTIPVGQDRVFFPMHRVYGSIRLPQLLNGWRVIDKEFWVKSTHNRWIMVDEIDALQREPVVHCYGLGFFVLERPDSP